MGNLVIYPDRMLANLNMTKGVIFSQMVLLKLIARGMSREDAYGVVQGNAMRSWNEGADFKQLLLKDNKVMSFMNSRDIEDAFKSENFLKHIGFIFERVFG
jgi:adenylosuccinate lyase